MQHSKPNKHDYSSTQVNLPEHVAKHVRAAAARIPDSKLAEDGREDEAHITLKYGLHNDDAEEVRQVLAEEPPIRVKLGKASFFPNGESDSGDVLKVDVHSPDLHRLNKKVSDALPHTDTHPDYTPHATIAYLKAGEGAKHAGRLVPGVSGREVTIHHVVFSSKSGEKTTIALAKPRRD